MNKKIAIFGIVFFLIAISSVMASSTVTYEITNFGSGLSLELYCDGSSLGTHNLASYHGMFAVNCDGSLRGDLYLDGTTEPIEVEYAIGTSRNYRFKFCGISQVPEFTTIGMALALFGSAAFYKFKSKYK